MKHGPQHSLNEIQFSRKNEQDRSRKICLRFARSLLVLGKHLSRLKGIAADKKKKKILVFCALGCLEEYLQISSDSATFGNKLKTN